MSGREKNKAVGKFIALIVWLLIAAVVAGFIIHFTGEPADVSTETSKGVLRSILEFFFGENNEDTVTLYNHYIRKFAHFFLFFAFSLSLNAALIHQDRLPRVPFTVALGAVFAVCDELRQYFVPGRATEIRDMLLDFSGVLLGVLIVTFLYLIVRKIIAKRAEKAECDAGE